MWSFFHTLSLFILFAAFIFVFYHSFIHLWLQAAAKLQTRCSFFWDVMQRRLVVGYRRFGNNISDPTHLRESSSLQRDCWTDDEGLDWLFRNVGKYQPPLRNIPEERKSHLYLFIYNIFGEVFNISENLVTGNKERI